MKNIIVVKIGGSTFGKGDTTLEDIVALQKKKYTLVVIHGGGSTLTEWLKRQGIEAKFVNGERVTDIKSLAVATAVLAGLVNKEITAAINLFGGKAVGISGVDGSLVESAMKSEDLGYVGSVDKVNTGLVLALLKAGFVPVISSIGLYSVDRAGEEPGIININADPFAGEIAIALKAKKLIYLTDVDGIKDKFGKTIPELSEAVAETLISSGAIVGGMIPKVDACLDAFNVGIIARIIDGRKSHALLDEIEKGVGGTTIVTNPPNLKLERQRDK